MAGTWKRFEHPQLGPVEVGGPDTRIGMWNPPLEKLAAVCDGQVAAFLRVAAMAPRLELHCEVDPLGDGVHRIRCEIINSGYLPTQVLESARQLAWNEPVSVSLEATGCKLEGGALPRLRIGHLEGWGRGRHGSGNAIFSQGGRGSGNRSTVTWFVRGSGTIRVRAGSPRCGWLERELPV